MQRLFTTYAVTPKGRIINSCTVDNSIYAELLIVETQVSKLTLPGTGSLITTSTYAVECGVNLIQIHSR
jgi:hypothetical protein